MLAAQTSAQCETPGVGGDNQAVILMTKRSEEKIIQEKKAGVNGQPYTNAQPKS